MTDEIKKHLFDIKLSLDSIDEFLGNEKNFFEYKTNKMLRRAVERELEIIGEATNRILNIDLEFPLTSKRQIIGLRNRVIHGYDKVDDEIVWGIIIKHLPILREEVEDLLES